MRVKLIVLFSLLSFINAFPQWQHIWTSSNIFKGVVSGWLHFDKEENMWGSRFYTIDSINMKIMEVGFTNSVAYTYTFNSAEKLLGEQIYSFGEDLNGNNTADFYILSGYGTSTNYRQAFKIFDFSTGAVLFEKNDPSYSYSYPSVYDIDNDGYLECMVVRTLWPSGFSYTCEVYKTSTSGSPQGNNPIPVHFKLMQNYPNPFNPTTKISYSVNSQSSVKLRIFDIKGETVRTLVEDYRSVGDYEVEWNGSNDSGMKQPTGVYFYELIVNGQKQVNKMILLK